MEAIKLKNISTGPPQNTNKVKVKLKTGQLLAELDDLQNLLYAESKHSVLVVIQGMDASGKDGTIRNVFGVLNPQGVMVQSYKEPTAEELSHDFLWRIHRHTPGKGMIQIFNRSQYEDILITRVHKMIDNATAKKRMKAINDFEELLTAHNDTHILKFYLHISPQEQDKRLHQRLNDKQKQWKYNENDFKEAKLWKEYMNMYEDCLNHCKKVPWIIVPSDHNWYKEYVVAKTLYDLLISLKMRYPGLKK